MAEKTVAVPNEQKRSSGKEGTRDQEQYITPPVDIYETEEGLVVMADLPGVAKKDLDVRVDNHVLTIQGRSAHAATGDPVYQEYRLVHFFRQFEMSDKVDGTKITAELKHGILTLSLPKAEEARPRHVEVHIA